MPTRNINLTDHLDQFVEDRVTSGRYGNASEIVREGLRLLEQREQEDRHVGCRTLFNGGVPADSATQTHAPTPPRSP